MTLNPTLRKPCCSWLFPNELGVYGWRWKQEKIWILKLNLIWRKRVLTSKQQQSECRVAKNYIFYWQGSSTARRHCGRTALNIYNQENKIKPVEQTIKEGTSWTKEEIKGRVWAKSIVKSWYKTTIEVCVNFGVHQSKYQKQYWKLILIGVRELHREK